MSNLLRNESTPAGKAIWQAVDNAAAKCPKWLKEHIEKKFDVKPPWTDVGRVQQDIHSIKSELHRKGDKFEIDSINRKVDSLEHTMREISTTLDGYLYRLQACEERLIRLEGEVNSNVR